VALAWSPDGKALATGGGADRTVRIRDAETGQTLQALEGHAGEVRALAWSPDGKTLAAGSVDKVVLLWRLPADDPQPLAGHDAPVTALAWSADGRYLASAGLDMTVRLWSSAGKALRTWPCRGNATDPPEAICLAWSPAAATLASAHSGALHLWGPDSDKPLRTLPGAQQADWAPDGKRLATCGPVSAQVIDAAGGQTLLTLPQLAFEHARHLALSPDGKYLALQDERGVALVRADTGTLVHSWQGHSQPVAALAWSPDGKRLATAGGIDDEHKVLVWDVGSPKWVRSLPVKPHRVRALAWSPDGKYLAAGTMRGATVHVWAAGGVQQEVKVFARLPHPVHAVAWAAGGKTLVAGIGDGTLSFWGAGTWEPRGAVQAFDGPVLTMAVSPDGKLLAAAGQRGKPVHVYDAEKRTLLQQLQEPRLVDDLAWLPDSEGLAVHLETGPVRTWDAATGKVRALRKPGPTSRPLLPVGGLLPGESTSWSVRLREPGNLAVLGTFVLFGRGSGHGYLSCAPTGAYRTAPDFESEVVCVVQTAEGQQALRPAEFAARFGWKNDPDQVRLAPRTNEK
jgi:WD40 repeat protein